MNASVLHLADYGGAYSGGFIASLHALAAATRGIGLDTVVAFGEGAASRTWVPSLERAGMAVRFMPSSRIHGVRAVARMVREHRSVLIHTHFTRFDADAALAHWLAPPHLRPTVIWHVHSAFPTRRGPRQALKDALRMRVLGRHAYVMTASPQLRQEMIRRGCPPDRVTVNLNGVDAGRLAVDRQTRVDLRSTLGIPHDAKVALAFGWEPTTKGVDVICAAAASLRDVHWIIVGEDALRRFVALRPEALPLVHIVEPREDVGVYYAAADAFVSASRWEGFSYALAEGVGAGLQAVATAIPGVQWATSIPGIRFVEPGDAAGLARAVRDACCDERPNTAGAARIRSEFGVEAWAARVAGFYDSVLARARHA